MSLISKFFTIAFHNATCHKVFGSVCPHLNTMAQVHTLLDLGNRLARVQTLQNTALVTTGRRFQAHWNGMQQLQIPWGTQRCSS